MIPYFNYPSINLGFFSINTWGLLANLGFALGIYIFWRKGKQWGVSGNKLLDLSFWIMLGAIIGARLGHVFFYEWGYYRAHLSEIVAVWHGGLSSLGGFIGGGAVVFLKIRKYSLPFWRTFDALVYALPFGLACGRIGCFLIHDHPGTLTHFFLGVKYPDGVRHDLGLELLFVNIALGITFLILSRRPRQEGFFLITFLLLYSPIRFFLDFLRETDIRYVGLTPAQYGMIGMFAVGLWLFYFQTKRVK